jgi:predicted ATPase
MYFEGDDPQRVPQPAPRQNNQRYSGTKSASGRAVGVEKMLKKLTIRNFKAIQDMTIEFTPLTVLIGENGCGKSTILQALDFLCSVASRDISEYLREKEWNFENLKSQCNGGITKPIEFISTWNLLVNEHPETIVWNISIDLTKGWVIKENITRFSDSKPVLSYRIDGQDDIPPLLGQLNIQSSALKYIAGTHNNTNINTDEIDKLFNFLSDSAGFGLLSPDKMRSGNKLSYTRSIGAGGEALAYCIDKMGMTEKQQLNKKVSDLIGTRIIVQTIDLGNKIEISVIFKTDDNTMLIDSLHISDGLLRIIAFAVISMEKKIDSLNNGMVSLDEIEDGINPYMTEKVVSLLRDLNDKQGRQIIITTHSPVILNDFNPEEIVFLWKDKNGSAHSRKFFETEEMRKSLDFLNPGEIWENYGKDAILSKLGIPSVEQ